MKKLTMKLLVLGFSVFLFCGSAMAAEVSGTHHAPRPIACYAQDSNGLMYWSTGYSPYLVQKRAMATCYYNASYCVYLGCQPIHQ